MAAALNIYYVLEGFDMGKAKAIVYKVHDSLQYQATQMVDEQMRESFLESVLEHRTFRRLHDMLKIQEEN